MMECVLVNVSQENIEFQEEKKIKRRITKNFYFTSIIIIGFFVLRLLDIISTVICLETFPFCREGNPSAVDIVEKPGLWMIINIIITGMLLAVNFALGFFNKKNDMTINYIAMGFGVMLLVVLIVCIWPVINNFGIIVKYIDQV